MKDFILKFISFHSWNTKNYFRKAGLLVILALQILNVFAQSKSLTNTIASPYAKLKSVDMGNVRWTSGFWADRFKMAKEVMVPNMWAIYNDAKLSHAFKNFEIAAGLDTGVHRGPSFHDGDFYKTLEAMASLYAATKDQQLDREMDKAIAVIAKSQREDGYIYTKAMIEQRISGVKNQFEDRLSFEAYNIGHLMTAACIHYRATGKSNLMAVAKSAADYLYSFYKKASPTLARNAICPSHYMGIIEMYRTLKDPRYLELAQHLIAIKGKIDDGTDDNQDRIPFLQQTKAMGHAVRANYLYAGVADLYAETGNKSLLNTLNLMWSDIQHRKMYVTGGNGSLYDGTSPDGTSYNPAEVQKIHQAFGRDFQLPNFTAHNETCANIGHMLFNWRMLQLSGDAKYADVVELELYNAILSGISIDGKNFLYTNPLAQSDLLPFKQRWSKDRVPYISLSNCCPPNVVRTLAQVANYAYSVSSEGVWVNLYGSNEASINLLNGSYLKLIQKTDYPWNGKINLRIEKVETRNFSLFLRIPGWARSAKVLVNGQPFGKPETGSYLEINRQWKTGDVVEISLPMPAELLAANPLVEENRNQIAVKRGPIVYCMESVDLPGHQVFSTVIPESIQFGTQQTTVSGFPIIALTGQAKSIQSQDWINKLYQPIGKAQQGLNIKLIPYFAWGNRGHSEMSVWLPLGR